ncbi:MAG: hypothetical protein JKY48_09350 [Flavobacteriales bacterium]|nr:hypothetical protein [Flavobacteriales bacterium]
MKTLLIGITFSLFSLASFGQTSSPSEQSKKVVEESWAKAQKDKAINDEEVARQRKAEEAKREEERNKALDNLIKKVDAEKPKSTGTVTPQ